MQCYVADPVCVLSKTYESTPFEDINILSWNVNGLHKFVDNCEVKAFLYNYNIIALNETWSKFNGEFNEFLESYIHFDFVRNMKNTSIRNSGGMSVYIKSFLAKRINFRRIFDTFDNCIVLYCEFSSFFKCEDIIMYFAYISPEGSCYYNDKEQKDGIINMLSHLECIRTEYFDTPLFIAGDMNSRCKDYLDFIPDDTLFHIFGNVECEGSYFDLPRSNRDNLRANNFGKSLVNLCCIFDVHFLNGRFSSDIDGNFTCISNDGASVVDYMLASSGLFYYIKDFCVIDRDESDHFPISCLLNLNQLPDETPVNIMTGNLLPFKRFKWKQDKLTQFTDDFKQLLPTI